MFNTGGDSELNVDCATDGTSTAFVCTATTAVHRGDVLLVPYGWGGTGGRATRLRNSVLLLEYGFTLDPADSATASSVLPEFARLALPPAANDGGDDPEELAGLRAALEAGWTYEVAEGAAGAAEERRLRQHLLAATAVGSGQDSGQLGAVRPAAPTTVSATECTPTRV